MQILGSKFSKTLDGEMGTFIVERYIKTANPTQCNKSYVFFYFYSQTFNANGVASIFEGGG